MKRRCCSLRFFSSWFLIVFRWFSFVERTPLHYRIHGSPHPLLAYHFIFLFFYQFTFIQSNICYCMKLNEDPSWSNLPNESNGELKSWQVVQINQISTIQISIGISKKLLPNRITANWAIDACVTFVRATRSLISFFLKSNWMLLLSSSFGYQLHFTHITK